MIIRTSYEFCTPEMDEFGLFAETGWHDEEGFDCMQDPDVDPVEAAILFLEDVGASLYSGGPGFFVDGYYSAEPIEDYISGESTTYNFHLSGFSESQQKTIWSAIIGQ